MIYDIAIIGAGMAGASLAAEIAPFARVLILESEPRAGVHATGRSAAFWNETYGGPGIQPLTSASGPWLQDRGFLRPRGALTIGRAADRLLLQQYADDFAGSGVHLDQVGHVEIARRITGIRDDWSDGVFLRTCADIDVTALHQHYMSVFIEAGAVLHCNMLVDHCAHIDGAWHISCGSQSFRAAIIVNAAGAWSDAVSAMAGAAPISITPYRRTVVQLRVDPPVSASLPLVLGINGNFYFKPERSGRLWLSPHDETPCAAGDVTPDRGDIAAAVEQLKTVVDWRIEAVDRAWAGLRSFARDRLPVFGFDQVAPSFFWFAGQGGFGIQTAPAAAKLAAGLLLDQLPDQSVIDIDPACYAPGRPALSAALLAS